jgi:hypothetical protein
MAKQKLSPALDACCEFLVEFDKAILADFPSRNGKFLPYTLNGVQVGAVHLLLSKAKKLEQENSELKQMLLDLQGDVDRSINYLDPER